MKKAAVIILCLVMLATGIFVFAGCKESCEASLFKSDLVKSVKIGSNFITESGIRPIYENNKIYIADDDIGYKTMTINSTGYKTVKPGLFDDIIQGIGYDSMEFCVDADAEQYGLTVYYAEILSNDQDENHVNKIVAGDLVIEINCREYGVGLHYEGMVSVA